MSAATSTARCRCHTSAAGTACSLIHDSVCQPPSAPGSWPPYAILPNRAHPPVPLASTSISRRIRGGCGDVGGGRSGGPPNRASAPSSIGTPSFDHQESIEPPCSSGVRRDRSAGGHSVWRGGACIGTRPRSLARNRTLDMAVIGNDRPRPSQTMHGGLSRHRWRIVGVERRHQRAGRMATAPSSRPDRTRTPPGTSPASPPGSRHAVRATGSGPVARTQSRRSRRTEGRFLPRCSALRDYR